MIKRRKEEEIGENEMINFQLDIDECTLAKRQCDHHVTCTNTEGLFVCGECPSGMYGSGYTECKCMFLLFLFLRFLLSFFS